VAEANADTDVHVIVLSGAGDAFCAGHGLMAYAQDDGPHSVTQEMPWDPMKDYAFMSRNTEHFMSLFRSHKPVVCKVHGFAVAGGSDIALCADLVVMAHDAKIGCMPARVRGVPTTAMWVYRLGAEQAERTLFTGDKIDGHEAARIGLVHKSVPRADLDEEVEALAHRISTVPINQLMMQKLMINQAIESMGLAQTQMIARVRRHIAPHA
jgi:enoyl-CoA hydratase